MRDVERRVAEEKAIATAVAACRGKITEAGSQDKFDDVVEHTTTALNGLGALGREGTEIVGGGFAEFTLLGLRAGAYTKLGELQRAFEDTERAFRMTPRSCTACAAKAERLEALGRSAEALKAFERAAALAEADDSRDASARRGLADAYMYYARALRDQLATEEQQRTREAELKKQRLEEVETARMAAEEAAREQRRQEEARRLEEVVEERAMAVRGLRFVLTQCDILGDEETDVRNVKEEALRTALHDAITAGVPDSSEDVADAQSRLRNIAAAAAASYY